MKRLYRWVLHWAETPYGTPALFLLALTESSFFPIPPDVLLIVLSLSIPAKAFYYALVSSVGSVIGGMGGYMIGLFFFEVIGRPIIDFYHMWEEYQNVRHLYQEHAFWAVFTAGFTPIPYKVFTIAAGVCKINFPIFIIASTVSRSLRFFMVSTLIYFFGERVKVFIERYFNILTIIFTILLIGGFILIKYIIK